MKVPCFSLPALSLYPSSLSTSGLPLSFACVQIQFTATIEEIAAYDHVEVPSGAVFTLDGAFVSSGACRGLNGNAPGPEGMERAFLAYQTGDAHMVTCALFL